MRTFERKQIMNPKFIIIGTIVLSAGVIGMVGAGTVVWVLMSHRSNQVAYQQFPGEPTPVPIRPAASATEGRAARPASLSGRHVVEQKIAVTQSESDRLANEAMQQVPVRVQPEGSGQETALSRFV